MSCTTVIWGSRRQPREEARSPAAVLVGLERSVARMVSSPAAPPVDQPLLDRALGSLYGLAIGDALGMPTQSMSSRDIRADYGNITDFVDAGPRQLIAAGMKAGTITDDTEQALLLAELLVAGHGEVDPAAFAQRLLAWERSMEAKGSLDLLGPSTKRAVERILNGVPRDEAGRFGSTNGAAMRIAPVGIARRPVPVDRLLASVVQASVITHNTSLGMSSAAAVGTAVSVGIDGGSLSDAIAAGQGAAVLGEQLGHPVAGGKIGPRIAWAGELLRSAPCGQWAMLIEDVIGTSVASQESVVAAFAILSVMPDPWDAMCMAATVGGDTDTMAAIVGAIVGAVVGVGGLPPDAITLVRTVNQLDLEPLARALLEIRTS